jgi:hypothetical protein
VPSMSMSWRLSTKTVLLLRSTRRGMLLSLPLDPELKDLSKVDDVVKSFSGKINHETYHGLDMLGLVKASERKLLAEKAAKPIPDAHLEVLNEAAIEVGGTPVPRGSSYMDYVNSVYGKVGERRGQIESINSDLEQGLITQEQADLAVREEESRAFTERDYETEAITKLIEGMSIDPRNMDPKTRGVLRKIADALIKLKNVFRGLGYNDANSAFQNLFGDSMAARIDAGKSLDVYWSRKDSKVADLQADLEQAKLAHAMAQKSRDERVATEKNLKEGMSPEEASAKAVEETKMDTKVSGVEYGFPIPDEDVDLDADVPPGAPFQAADKDFSLAAGHPRINRYGFRAPVPDEAFQDSPPVRNQEEYVPGETGAAPRGKIGKMPIVVPKGYTEVIATSDENLISDSAAQEAAETQRGEPEDVMLEITSVRETRVGFPAVLADLLEHVGDISNRAQQHQGIAVINVREKINKVLGFDPSKGRLSLEKDIEQSRYGNAEYNIFREDPEFVRLESWTESGQVWENEGYKGRWELWDKFRKKYPKPFIEQQMEIQRQAEVEPLARYVKAHQDHNVALTEMGKLGKDMAIHLGRGEYDALMSKAKVLDGLVSEYENLISQGRGKEAENLRLRSAGYNDQGLDRRIVTPEDVSRIDEVRFFHGSPRSSLAGLERGDQGGALGDGIYFTPNFDRARSYGRNVYSAKLNIKNPVVIDQNPKSRLPAPVDVLVELGMGRDTALDLVERQEEEHGYVRNQLRYTAEKKGHDGILQFIGGELAEVVAFDEGQVELLGTIPENEGVSVNTNLKDIEAGVAPDSVIGFGMEMANRNLPQIQQHTPYTDVDELLDGFARFAETAPKGLNSDRVQVIKDSGRLHYIWDDPNTSADMPVQIVFDIEQDESVGGPVASLVNVAVSDKFYNEWGDPQTSKGLIPRFKDGSNIKDVQAALNNKVAKRFSESEKRDFALSAGEARLNGPSQAVVDSLMPLNEGYNKNFFQAIRDGFWKPSKGTFNRFLDQAVDQWVFAEVQGRKAAEAMEKKGLPTWQVNLASWESISQLNMFDRSNLLTDQAMNHGVITYKDGVISVEPLEMENSGTAFELDPDSGRLRQRRVSVPDMYQEGKRGGFQTILSPGAVPGKKFLRAFFTYLAAVRSKRFKEMDPNLNVPLSPEEIVNGINIINDPEIGEMVGVMAHNYQNWNAGNIEGSVEAGVMSRGMAESWVATRDFLPFYSTFHGFDEASTINMAKAMNLEGREHLAGVVGGRLQKRYERGVLKEHKLMSPVEAIAKNTNSHDHRADQET